MKEIKRKITADIIENGSLQSKDRYTVLVSIQDREQIQLLIPPAIDLATKNQGKIIILSIIEIPYQLPPSDAQKFIVERERMLRQELKMLEHAECRSYMAIRIAHNINNAIEHFSKNKHVNIIIREHNPENQSDTVFDRLKNNFTSWF